MHDFGDTERILFFCIAIKQEIVYYKKCKKSCICAGFSIKVYAESKRSFECVHIAGGMYCCNVPQTICCTCQRQPLQRLSRHRMRSIRLFHRPNMLYKMPWRWKRHQWFCCWRRRWWRWQRQWQW